MQTGAATRLARSRNPQMDPLAPHLSAAVTGASFALATASPGRAPAAGERRACAAIAYNARVDRGGYDRTAAPSTERHAALARRSGDLRVRDRRRTGSGLRRAGLGGENYCPRDGRAPGQRDRGRRHQRLRGDLVGTDPQGR